MKTHTVTAHIEAIALDFHFLLLLLQLVGEHQQRAGQYGPKMTVKFYAPNDSGIITMEAEAF